MRADVNDNASKRPFSGFTVLLNWKPGSRQKLLDSFGPINSPAVPGRASPLALALSLDHSSRSTACIAGAEPARVIGATSAALKGEVSNREVRPEHRQPQKGCQRSVCLPLKGCAIGGCTIVSFR